MRILIDNLISRLETDNPNILSALYEKYGYLVPGYNYVPAYRNRKWDGRKRYFKKDGTFRSGLLPRILADLYSIGVNPKELVLDGEPKLTDPFDLPVLNVDKFTYRDYQKEAINSILSEKRMILSSPTSSGKTLIMAGMIKSLQPLFKKMVVLFDRKILLKQTYDFFKLCGIDDVGISSGEGFVYGNIMLCMVQSIERILDTHLKEAEVLIVDEVHKFCHGETSIAVVESFPNAFYRVGFTATVPSEKEDINARLTLEGAFGTVCHTKTVEELIEDGSIAKPIIQIIKFDPGTKKEEKKNEADYTDLYERYIIDNEDRNNKIIQLVNTIKINNNKAKILILVKNLNHLKNLKLKIPDAFIVEGKDSLEERYKSINDFISSESFSVIIGTNVMDTGVSIDQITHMINARGLEGEIPTIQALGRAVRKSNNKVNVYYYDFYDVIPYLEKHSKKRIKHYSGLGLEINYVEL